MRYVSVCLRSVAAIAALAGTAIAHPGHGTTDPNSVTHYVAEPVHAAPLLAVFAVSVAAISLLAAARRRHSR